MDIENIKGDKDGKYWIYKVDTDSTFDSSIENSLMERINDGWELVYVSEEMRVYRREAEKAEVVKRYKANYESVTSFCNKYLD